MVDRDQGAQELMQGELSMEEQFAHSLIKLALMLEQLQRKVPDLRTSHFLNTYHEILRAEDLAHGIITQEIHHSPIQDMKGILDARDVALVAEVKLRIIEELVRPYATGMQRHLGKSFFSLTSEAFNDLRLFIQSKDDVLVDIISQDNQEFASYEFLAQLICEENLLLDRHRSIARGVLGGTQEMNALLLSLYHSVMEGIEMGKQAGAMCTPEYSSHQASLSTQLQQIVNESRMIVHGIVLLQQDIEHSNALVYQYSNQILLAHLGTAFKDDIERVSGLRHGLDLISASYHIIGDTMSRLTPQELLRDPAAVNPALQSFNEIKRMLKRDESDFRRMLIELAIHAKT